MTPTLGGRYWCDRCRTHHTDATPHLLTPTWEVPGCTGKVAHSSAREAVVNAAKQGWRGLHPYPCRHCGLWHLSKTSPRERRLLEIERIAVAASEEGRTA